MSYDYSSLQATAVRLIARFGTSGTLIQRGAPTGPQNRPTYGPDTTTAIMAVSMMVEAKDDGGETETEEELIVSVSGLSAVSIAAGDRIDWQGKTFSIVSVAPLRPGPTTLYWKVMVRHG
ncbi:MAG: hypothetical protein AAFR68_08340 [Pseudomonadota bacterium]